uniref:Cytochrome P450 n=1 Tax=Kalanchoe fedtschenkoi TaxID=63787 RepID=A0A7N0V371_KALFE
MLMHAAMDGSSLLVQVSVALLASLASILLISWLGNKVVARKSRRLALPPGPRGLPLVGYLPFLGTDLHLTFAKLGSVHGPIFKVWLGNKMYVVVSSPEVVRQVVREKDTIFANRDAARAARIATYDANDIAFRDYGPEWRKMRKIFVHKMLGNATLDASFRLRRGVVARGVKEVYGQIGRPVKIGAVGLLTVINSMVAMIWGASEDGGGPDWEALMEELMVLVGAPNVSDFFPALAWLDMQGICAKMRLLIDQFEGLFEVAIARIRSGADGGGGDGSFLPHLVGLQHGGDPSSSLTMTQIKGMLMDTAVGGTDTTATIFEWALSELLLHPQAMKRAQDELTQVVGVNNHVAESHLPKLKYLDGVVKETLRLHPAFPLLIPRRPSEETEVGGYRVPKDATVFVNVWAIHRDPALWDEPSAFRPERFLDGATKWDYSGKDLRYLPFGSGRRSCPGLPLAERALMYTLAVFLHLFEWAVPEGVEIGLEEKFGLVMKKKETLVAIPTPRFSNADLYG